jgi:1,4-dihydroxy-2-naphthoyl-CoA hydrolase
MAFSHPRTIHFADTDAAGVVFFANYLAICHEGYEEALAAAGINLQAFFSDKAIIVPIAKTEVEFLRPLEAGEKVRVTAAPTLLTENSYEVRFEIIKLSPREKTAARVRTEHVCLDATSRKRIPLPAALAAWVAAAG